MDFDASDDVFYVVSLRHTLRADLAFSFLRASTRSFSPWYRDAGKFVAAEVEGVRVGHGVRDMEQGGEQEE